MNFFRIKQSLILVYCFFSIHITFADIARDLDLNALFTTINLTKTDQGNDALRAILAQPLSDVAALESRQGAIKYIADDAQLHTQLQVLLHTFNKQEPYFERIMQPANDIETAAFEEFYFSTPALKSWNCSPALLELGYLAHCGNLCSSMVQHALAFAIFTWGLEEEHVCPSHPAKKDHHHHHDKKNHTHKKHNHTADTPCSHSSHSHATPNPFKVLAQSKQFKYAFQLWHGAAQIQELYSIQAIIRANLHCIKNLQSQLMGVARGIRVLNRIHTALKDHPECTAHLTQYKNLENMCTSNTISEKLQTLLTLLQTATFKGKPSAFSRIGIILATYKLAQDIAHELKPALAAIGEIDAYTSCAQLLKNNQSTPLQYSFAQYDTHSASPSLRAHNFWHPLMSADTIQLNSISLGVDNNPRNIVLTGPNACGKSTNLKALTLCVYYAQTITIVPAEKYSQTLYKEIYSSIMVSDSIQENKSLFVAELTDAENLLTRVENLAHGEYMFIALDEFFKSTHHKKGPHVAYQLLEHLYTSKQIISIVSTHFEKLIELAESNNSPCANYTVNKFTLEPGIGSPENSFDIVNAQIKSRLLG